MNRKDAKNAKTRDVKNEDASTVEAVAEVVEGIEVGEDDQVMPKPKNHTSEDDQPPSIQEQE